MKTSTSAAYYLDHRQFLAPPQMDIGRGIFYRKTVERGEVDMRCLTRNKKAGKTPLFPADDATRKQRRHKRGNYSWY